MPKKSVENQEIDKNDFFLRKKTEAPRQSGKPKKILITFILSTLKK